jgi:hypothetical protein
MTAYHIQLSAFLPIDGEYNYAGGGSRTFEGTLEEAQEVAKQWVGRNRGNNPDVPQLRYAVEIADDNGSIWTHDESKGAPLVDAIHEEGGCCGGSCHS